MAHPFKHVGSLVIVLLIAYFVIRNWGGIKAAVTGSTAPGQTPGGSLLSFLGLNPRNASNGAPGDPAFSSAFGGSGSGFSGNGNGVNLFQGPLQRDVGGGIAPTPDSGDNRPGGFGGGAIEQGNTQGGGNIGNVPNSFGNCSVNPHDGKLVCV